MKIVNKISVKNVVGDVPTKDVKIPKMKEGVPAIDNKGEVIYETVQRGIKQDVMRVFGQCDKIKLGNTQYGETVEFIGNFEATDILTGEIYRGSRLFLPPVLTDMLRAEVVAAGETGVQFAFDIGIDSANNAHGYQYTITPLTAPSVSDPLAQMKAALLANAPALPSPKAVEALAAPLVGAEAEPEEAEKVSTETKPAAKAKK